MEAVRAHTSSTHTSLQAPTGGEFYLQGGKLESAVGVTPADAARRGRPGNHEVAALIDAAVAKQVHVVVFGCVCVCVCGLPPPCNTPTVNGPLLVVLCSSCCGCGQTFPMHPGQRQGGCPSPTSAGQGWCEPLWIASGLVCALLVCFWCDSVTHLNLSLSRLNPLVMTIGSHAHRLGWGE